MINLAKWNELPKNYQAVVTAAAGLSNIEQTARYDARNPAALKRLVAAGTQLRPFSQAIMEAFSQGFAWVNAETSAAIRIIKRSGIPSRHFETTNTSGGKLRSSATTIS